MFEIVNVRNVTASTALAGVVLLAAGCENSSSPKIDTKLVRCETQPQPDPVVIPDGPLLPSPEPLPVRSDFKSDATYTKAIDQYLAQQGQQLSQFEKQEKDYEQLLSPPPITLTVNSYGSIEANPLQPDATVQDKVLGAIVKLASPDATGSGFLMNDNSGDEVVVTAAHVIGSSKLKDVTITDNAGNETKAIDGCYFYDNNGQFADLSTADKTPGHVDTDLAILKIRKQIGTNVLRLASHAPKRGNWDFFFNYQQDAQPGYPVEYSGLVSFTPPIRELTVVTGLESFGNIVDNDSRRLLMNNNHIEPGASGGVVVDAAGNVVGMSIAGMQGYSGERDLESYDNLEVTGTGFGDKAGFEPIEADLTSAELIQKGLAAPAIQ